MASNTEPFDIRYADLVEAASDLAPLAVFAVNDPPWAALRGSIPTPLQVLAATSMEEDDLAAAARGVDDRVEVAVGIGGGTAIDTAKYLSWSLGIPAVFLPTIASVDATFTDAVGVRRERRVSYIGKVRPLEVVLDLARIAAAPARLNRAGIGDILSCHTGLFDWRLAAARSEGAAWNAELAGLGVILLDELETAAPDIHASSQEGVRFLMDAYRRIGAACAAAGHSRFEEGSEHFLGYALEEDSGQHYVHGELISLCVVAMSGIQGNDPDRPRRIIEAAGTFAHPDAVGVTKAEFLRNLMRLGTYVRDEGLDYCIVSEAPVSEEQAEQAWESACQLPGGDGDR